MARSAWLGLLVPLFALLAGCASGEGATSETTTGVPAGSEFEPEDGSWRNPRYAPTGKRIALLHRPARGEEGASIQVLDTVKKTIVDVTVTNSNLTTPAWSPDGTALYFTDAQGIAKVPADGGMPTRVLDAPGATGLDVSPDEKMIVYTVEGEPTKLVTLADMSAVALPSSTVAGARFSPDGTKVALVSTDPNDGDHPVIMYDIEAGELTKLYDTLTDLAALSWYGDGANVAVSWKQGVQRVAMPEAKSRVPIIEGKTVTALDVAPDGSTMAYTLAGKTLLYVAKGVDQ